jgi:hypothetical protein
VIWSSRAALVGVREHTQAINGDTNAAYRVAEAVAFGDFMGDAVRGQAAGVGVRLVPRSE